VRQVVYGQLDRPGTGPINRIIMHFDNLFLPDVTPCTYPR
jgi:hypothetical protein